MSRKFKGGKVIESIADKEIGKARLEQEMVVIDRNIAHTSEQIADLQEDIIIFTTQKTETQGFIDQL